jgi:hypothetical protein
MQAITKRSAQCTAKRVNGQIRDPNRPNDKNASPICPDMLSVKKESLSYIVQECAPSGQMNSIMHKTFCLPP